MHYRIIQRWLSPAVASVFVAMAAGFSATAEALPGRNTVNSGDIKDGQVKNRDLSTNAVTGAKVSDGTLTGADINPILQSGQTESGVFGASANVNGGLSLYTIEFDPKLPADIPAANTTRLSPAATTVNCPGQGQAAPGHLCVYETFNVTSTPAGGFFHITTANSGAEDIGTILFWTAGGTQSRVWGTWAVTAP